MTISKSCESNYIAIVEKVAEISLLNQSQKNEVVCEILHSRRELQFHSNGICSCKGTRFFFNFNVTSEKQLDHSQDDFIFNANLSFIDELYRNIGDKIYDKRFTGFYRFTSRMLKKEFMKMYNEFIGKNKTICDNEIENSINNALDILQHKSDLFNDEHNQQKDNTFNKIKLSLLKLQGK